MRMRCMRRIAHGGGVKDGPLEGARLEGFCVAHVFLISIASLSRCVTIYRDTQMSTPGSDQGRGVQLAGAAATATDAEWPKCARTVTRSDRSRKWVEARGLEPLTSALQRQRSTS